MSALQDMGSHSQIVKFLRSTLSVFYVFSNEIVDRDLFVRARSSLVNDNSCTTDEAVPLELTICRHTLAMGCPLVIEDAHAHPLTRGCDSLTALGVGSYLGVPVFQKDTQVPWTLAAIHVHPREWIEDEVRLMVDAAARIVSLPL